MRHLTACLLGAIGVGGIILSVTAQTGDRAVANPTAANVRDHGGGSPTSTLLARLSIDVGRVPPGAQDRRHGDDASKSGDRCSGLSCGVLEPITMFLAGTGVFGLAWATRQRRLFGSGVLKSRGDHQGVLSPWRRSSLTSLDR
jgi:hypothetical protein